MGAAVCLPPDAVIEIALDKKKTLSYAHELGIHYPRSVPIPDLDELSVAAAKFGFPVKAGVAFPWLIWQWAIGQPIDKIVTGTEGRSGGRSRYLIRLSLMAIRNPARPRHLAAVRLCLCSPSNPSIL
jgi:hypothetical protein